MHAPTVSRCVPGLYLTGQDVLLQGLWGAMMSGVLTVIAVSKARQLPARDTRARAPPALPPPWP